MSSPTRDILRLLNDVNRHRGQATSLATMSELAHRSPWNLHRWFVRVTGETPKQYGLRVRLDRASAQLVSTDDPVSRVAFDHGFASHEVFSRSFARRFGLAPVEYRNRGLIGATAPGVADVHADVVATASPCIGLHRLSTTRKGPPNTMTIDAHVADRPAFTMLMISRRTTREGIPEVLGECLQRVFGYVMREGLALTGPAMARYPEIGMGSLVIECGTTVAQPPSSDPEGDIEVLTIPAGPAAITIHHGPYDELHTTYEALEVWLAENGYVAAGPPREVYLTDPGEHPDPATWQTEISQPVTRREP